MTKNVGTIDRIVRTIAFVAIAILVATKSLTGVVAIVLGIIGVFLLITAIVGFCPLYALLKISTLKKKAE